MGPRVAGGEGISPFALAMVRMLGATVFFQIFTRAAKLLRPTTTRDKVWLAGLSLLGIALEPDALSLRAAPHEPDDGGARRRDDPWSSPQRWPPGWGTSRASLRLVAGLGSSIAGVAWLTSWGACGWTSGGSSSSRTARRMRRTSCTRARPCGGSGRSPVVTWIFTWGAAIFAPLGLPFVARRAADVERAGWELIAYILVMPTIVAYLCNAWALGR